MARLSLANWPSADPVIKLPHPYLTPYFIKSSSRAASSSPTKLYQLSTPEQPESQTQAPPEPLHSESLHFSEPEDLKSSELPPQSNNTAWARARRSPSSSLTWDGDAAPTPAQTWLFIYVLFTVRPDEEFIRLSLNGAGSDTLANQLRATMLAVDHPQQGNSPKAGAAPEELVLLRASFWQGAGSPFGARGAWVPTDIPGTVYASAAAPALTYTMTSDAGAAQAWHPRRAPKPRPGSTVYSRWVPHLRETFSMVALDQSDPSHVALFHAWQNDPRVSAGWDEAGTLDQHKDYLARAHADPHRLAVLAAFDGVFFAYFETYWAREDPLGAYYPSTSDFDRGRHSLVGDVRYRGAHRVGAWWSSLMHYLFLDDPRTMQVVGDPKFTNSTVLAYDLVHGFGLDKFVDLPHKRGALMRCSRERFFQICPLAEDERERKQKVVGGTLVGLVPKL